MAKSYFCKEKIAALSVYRINLKLKMKKSHQI